METTKLQEKGKQMELLKLYLKNGQRENYYLILGEIVSRLNQFESMHDMNALELYYSVSVLMMQYINEQGISEKLAFRIGLYKLMNFNEYGSWAEAGIYPEKTNGTVQTASLVYRGKSPDHREKSRLSVFTFLFADVPCLHGNVTE